jgi:hypothetical protein
MRLAIICALCAALIGTPCLYDATSQEPSPLAGGFAAAFGKLLPAPR